MPAISKTTPDSFQNDVAKRQNVFYLILKTVMSRVCRCPVQQISVEKTSHMEATKASTAFT